jgi:hypothetical protein
MCVFSIAHTMRAAARAVLNFNVQGECIDEAEGMPAAPDVYLCHLIAGQKESNTKHVGWFGGLRCPSNADYQSPFPS